MHTKILACFFSLFILGVLAGKEKSSTGQHLASQPARDNQQINLTSLQDSISERSSTFLSKLLTDKPIFEFIQSACKTRILTARMPFSMFGARVIELLKAIKIAIRQPDYDISLDNMLKPLVENIQIVALSANPSTKNYQGNHFLIFKFSEEIVGKLLSSIKPILKSKAMIFKDKVKADYMNSIIIYAADIQRRIQQFDLKSPIVYEKTTYFFEPGRNALDLEETKNQARELVRTLVIIEDIINDNYHYTLPLSELKIYNDFVVLFDSLFRIIIKTANLKFEVIVEVLIKDFLSLQKSPSVFKVSEVNRNGIYSFPAKLKSKLIRDLEQILDFIIKECDDKILLGYCATTKDHIERLLAKIGRTLFKMSDSTVSSYDFRNPVDSTPLALQKIDSRLKSSLKHITEVQKNGDWLLKQKFSPLLVYANKILNASLDIFGLYEQDDTLLDTYLKLFEVIETSYKESFVSETITDGGASEYYLNYPLKVCLDLTFKVRDWSALFSYQTIFNMNDQISISHFEDVLLNTHEAWNILRNQITAVDNYCQERIPEGVNLGLIPIKSDPLSDSKKNEVLTEDFNLESNESPIQHRIDFGETDIGLQDPVHKDNLEKNDYERSFIEEHLYEESKDISVLSSEALAWKDKAFNEANSYSSPFNRNEELSKVKVVRKRIIGPTNIKRKIILIEIMNCALCLKESGLSKFVRSLKLVSNSP